MTSESTRYGPDTHVYRCDRIPDQVLSQIHALFAVAYRNANHDYLDKSLRTLRFVAVARENNIMAGFALGDCVLTDLPGISGSQTVVLGGLSCIATEYRRQGLFGSLERMATHASGMIRKDRRILGCGRMAHPASFSGMSCNPTVIPKPNVPITGWQKEIGLRIAELYKVPLDPETFIVRGEGKPIGYPEMKIDVPDAEWRIFKDVDRDRGDSLLGISWSPDAPGGW